MRKPEDWDRWRKDNFIRRPGLAEVRLGRQGSRETGRVKFRRMAISPFSWRQPNNHPKFEIRYPVSGFYAYVGQAGAAILKRAGTSFNLPHTLRVQNLGASAAL